MRTTENCIMMPLHVSKKQLKLLSTRSTELNSEQITKRKRETTPMLPKEKVEKIYWGFKGKVQIKYGLN